MKAIKWVFILVLIFFSMGCASVEPNLFRNILSEEPNIGPEQLQKNLNSTPVIDKQVNASFRYQVYKVGFFNNLNAVYFQNGQMVAQAPYDKYTNIKTLLQVGAISQDEYNKENIQFQNDDAEAASKTEQQQTSSDPVMTSMPGTCYGNSCDCVFAVDCAGTCNGTATTDACGVCGGNGSSCALPST